MAVVACARQDGDVVIEMRLERVAHGGVVVGRHDDKVVFVRGGLEGELVAVEVTETGRRFDRGHVVDVLEPSPHRVVPPCRIAAVCGGCDWQHVAPDHQLELKRSVVAEQLQRLAGLEWNGMVERVEPILAWRTRMRYATTPEGDPGLRGARSHDVVPLPPEGCLIAAPGPSVEDLRHWGEGASEVEVVISDDASSVLVDGKLVSGPSRVRQHIASRRYEVSAAGFWQVHAAAAETLTSAVLAGVEPRVGESALDLYCGAGLFAGALADAGCGVLGVERGARAVRDARRNVPAARFVDAPVDRYLASHRPDVDVVVLDPPRKGAGAAVVRAIAGLRPRVVSYVACDPASLARDLATFAQEGFVLRQLRAFDLFPMTHHVECVATLDLATAP